MILEFSPRFERDVHALDEVTRNRVKKALQMLETNPRHPGLHVKKMQGHKNIWEARVSLRYRITFHVSSDVIYLRRVGPHDIEQQP